MMINTVPLERLSETSRRPAREIRVGCSEETIRAYQAHTKEVAETAVEKRSFSAPDLKGAHDLDQTVVSVDNFPLRLWQKDTGKEWVLAIDLRL